MTESEHVSWTAPEATLPAGRDLASHTRQLALVDRIIGLEAQVAQLAAETQSTPSEHLRVERQLVLLRSSPELRAGRVVSAPIFALRRAVRRRRGAGV